jgi:hypothetical protein
MYRRVVITGLGVLAPMVVALALQQGEEKI